MALLFSYVKLNWFFAFSLWRGPPKPTERPFCAIGLFERWEGGWLLWEVQLRAYLWECSERENMASEAKVSDSMTSVKQLVTWPRGWALYESCPALCKVCLSRPLECFQWASRLLAVMLVGVGQRGGHRETEGRWGGHRGVIGRW